MSTKTLFIRRAKVYSDPHHKLDSSRTLFISYALHLTVYFNFKCIFELQLSSLASSSSSSSHFTPECSKVSAFRRTAIQVRDISVYVGKTSKICIQYTQKQIFRNIYLMQSPARRHLGFACTHNAKLVEFASDSSKKLLKDFI